MRERKTIVATGKKDKEINILDTVCSRANEILERMGQLPDDKARKRVAGWVYDKFGIVLYDSDNDEDDIEDIGDIEGYRSVKESLQKLAD